MFADIFRYLKKIEFVRIVYWKLSSFYAKLGFRVANRKVALGRRVQIIGAKNIVFAGRASIADNTWINLNKRTQREELVVGECSHIGRNNFISVGQKLEIGPYFFSSVNCSIIGATHEDDPFRPYIDGPTNFLGNGIIIGTNVFMGANSKIIGGVRIGFGSIIAANACVIRDVPPLSLVVGYPAKVISRFCLERLVWDDLFDLNSILGITEQEYLVKIQERYGSISTPYFAVSERSGWL